MKGHAGAHHNGNRSYVSTESKIHAVSSTETDIISVGEKLPTHLWLRNFVIEQSGDPSQVRVLYQDNKSAILLQNKGRLSYCKGSKHIHIRYFFITDRIKQKEIRGEYCPTGAIVADFLPSLCRAGCSGSSGT